MINQENFKHSGPELYGDDPFATVRLPGVFLASHLASTDNLT